jgi:hypothetical protein
MITKQQAEQLVYERINAPNPQWPDMPEMIVVQSDERDTGWVVYWRSRPWHGTRDFRHAIAGNGPYLVCREDGALFETGTAPPIEQRIREAEHRLQSHLQRLNSR